jgi:hypothetical protein
VRWWLLTEVGEAVVSPANYVEGGGFMVLGGGQTRTAVDLTWTRGEREEKMGAERRPPPLIDAWGERERKGGGVRHGHTTWRRAGRGSSADGGRSGGSPRMAGPGHTRWRQGKREREREREREGS